MTVDLQYASPAIAVSRPGLFRIALACGAIPLGSGIGVFLLWLLLGGTTLTIVGLALIPIGGGLFLAGSGSLIAYVRNQRKVKGEWRRAIDWRVVAVASLLLVNFPAALACLAGASYIMDTRVISVSNATSTPVDSFIVHTSQRAIELGPIAPNATVRFRYRVRGDTEVTYTMSQAGSSSTGTIEPYGTDMSGPFVHQVVIGKGSPTTTSINRAW
jgi:hypothetical protein